MYLLREGTAAGRPASGWPSVAAGRPAGKGRAAGGKSRSAWGARAGPRVQLLGSGTILREVLAAADLLAADYGVIGDVWSVPSFTELRRDGLAAERWNMLHPTRPAQAQLCRGLSRRPSGAGGRPPRPTMSSPSRTGSGPSCGSATGSWAPMASGGRTTAGARRAASSRLTGTRRPRRPGLAR